MTHSDLLQAAPEWQLAGWLNAPSRPSLAALRGRVVVLHVFQMLCPGCVSHGIPQAQRIREAFPLEDLAVIGLHSVFEHHAVMGEDALRAFVHEYRIGYPVAIDAPSPDSPIPRTMQAYRMQGTPSLLLIDRLGRLRSHQFGRPDDLRVGAALGRLLGETEAQATGEEGDGERATGCDAQGCRLPP